MNNSIRDIIINSIEFKINKEFGIINKQFSLCDRIMFSKLAAEEILSDKRKMTDVINSFVSHKSSSKNICSQRTTIPASEIISFYITNNFDYDEFEIKEICSSVVKKFIYV